MPTTKCDWVDEVPCQARQTSDQMTCSCGNVWDMNDPEPPTCRTVAPRHPATPNYLEYPTFEESCDFEPVGVVGGSLIERYEQLVRENKQLRAQLETFRRGHYQTQAALARSAIAGEIKHGGAGVRVALTSEGLSLPAGTLLVAAGGGK